MDTPNNLIETLVAEAAARGAVAQAEEEAKIAAELAAHAEKEAGRKMTWFTSLGLPGWTYFHAEITLNTFSMDNHAKLTLPGCAPIHVKGDGKLSVADRISVECDDDNEYYVSYSYADWYGMADFDRVVYEATQLYPQWQAAHAEVERLNAAPKPTPAVTPAEAAPRTNPNSAESAGRLLRNFIQGDVLIEYHTDDADMRIGDDRAVVLAAQLLSIATSLERIANRLEAA